MTDKGPPWSTLVDHGRWSTKTVYLMERGGQGGGVPPARSRAFVTITSKLISHPHTPCPLASLDIPGHPRMPPRPPGRTPKLDLAPVRTRLAPDGFLLVFVGFLRTTLKKGNFKKLPFFQVVRRKRTKTSKNHCGANRILNDAKSTFGGRPGGLGGIWGRPGTSQGCQWTSKTSILRDTSQLNNTRHRQDGHSILCNPFKLRNATNYLNQLS